MRSRRPVPPHRILGKDDVAFLTPGAWRVAVQDSSRLVEDGGFIPGWQPGLGIRLSNAILINREATARLSEATTGAMDLGAVVVALTAEGLATVAISRAKFQEDGRGSLIAGFDLEIDGRMASRNVRLECSVVLSSPTVGGDRLTPRMVGSRLWNGSWAARLEGGKARLPIEVVPFSRFFLRPGMEGGLVHVELAADPTLDIEQGMIVYLNAEQPRFVDAFAHRDPHATSIVWDAVIRRLLVAGADAGFDVAASYGRGTIGANWQQWATSAFSGLSADGLLEMHRGNVSEFETRLQSWGGMARAFTGAGVGA